jgi:hypothetical protein
LSHGRIRFSDAVPVGRDRRDLRRRFRRTARAVRAERRAEMAALLQRLSSGGVLLADITTDTLTGDGVIEFLDGTRLHFTTHRNGLTMAYLSQWCQASPVPLRLVRAEPSFTRRWFRLWFAADGRRPKEVVAEVSAVS